MTGGPVCVLAWRLAEGDLMPGGERLLSVQRDLVGGLIAVAADDGSYRRFGPDDRVVVARPAMADAVAAAVAGGVDRPAWRVAAFVASARRGRRPGAVLGSGGGWCGG